MEVGDGVTTIGTRKFLNILKAQVSIAYHDDHYQQFQDRQSDILFTLENPPAPSSAGSSSRYVQFPSNLSIA